MAQWAFASAFPSTLSLMNLTPSTPAPPLPHLGAKPLLAPRLKRGPQRLALARVPVLGVHPQRALL